MNYLAHDRCDTCGWVGLVAMLHDHGVLVLTQCKTCMPSTWTHLAEVQKERYLSGGDPSQVDAGA